MPGEFQGLSQKIRKGGTGKTEEATTGGFGGLADKIKKKVKPQEIIPPEPPKQESLFGKTIGAIKKTADKAGQFLFGSESDGIFQAREEYEQKQAMEAEQRERDIRRIERKMPNKFSTEAMLKSAELRGGTAPISVGLESTTRKGPFTGYAERSKVAGEVDIGQPFRSVVGSFSSGALGSLEGIVGAVEWAGVEKAKPVADKLNEWSRTLAPEDPSMLEKVVSGFGSASTFFIPGLGAMKGATLLARVSPKIALIFANSASTALEAATEAGLVYRENRERGMSERGAQWEATKTFGANALLIYFTQKYGIFSEGSKTALKRTIGSALQEGTQESVQQIISNLATGKKWDEGVVESGAIGAIVGAGLTNLVGAETMARVPPQEGEIPEAPQEGAPPPPPPAGEEKEEPPKAIELQKQFEGLAKKIRPDKTKTSIEDMAKTTEVISREEARQELEDTGSVTIAERSDGMRLVMKDEGDYIKVGIDTGTLLDTEDAKNLPEKSFSSIDEAFDFIETLRDNRTEELDKLVSTLDKIVVYKGERYEVIGTSPSRFNESGVDEIELMKEGSDLKKIREGGNPLKIPLSEVTDGIPDARDRLSKTFEEIPAEIEEEANKDWLDNYAEKFGELSDKVTRLEQLLKNKGADKVAVKKDIAKYNKEMSEIENGFIDKWQKAVEEGEQKKIEEPEEIEEEREERKTVDDITTSEGVAKDMLRVYIERGETIQQIKAGQLGVYGDDYKASVGGFINGKRVAPDFVIVEKIGKKEVNQKVSLKKIFDEIKAEKKAPKLGSKEGVEAVEEAVKNVQKDIEAVKKPKSPEGIARVKQLTETKEYLEGKAKEGKRAESKKEIEKEVEGIIARGKEYARSKGDYIPERGDMVSFKGKNGEELTGEVRHSDIHTSSIEVDQILSPGGVPIGRIEIVDNKNLKPLSVDKSSGIIKENEPTSKQTEISDTSDVSSEDDLGGGEQVAKETSGYDRATMLVESRDGLGATKANELTKRERQLVNEQVEQILESKNYSTLEDDYSVADLDLMNNYSGAGGKESVGGEGAGLLNEYYTPPEVIERLWAIAKSVDPDARTAFEPSAGIGSIINDAPPWFKVDGAEISKVSGTIAKIFNPDSDITIGDFQELFFDKATNKQKPIKEYDLLIGNPPFGARAGFLKGKGEEPKIGRQEEYFIKRGLDMTKLGGHLIYVVNSSFLQTQTTAGKEAISKLGRLVDAYRLPENSFADTSIGTDIVVFERTPTITDSDSTARLEMTKRQGDIIGDTYFKENPDNILGEVKTRKNRFGKEETYVVGELDKAVEAIDDILSKRMAEHNAEVTIYNAEALKKSIEQDKKNARESYLRVHQEGFGVIDRPSRKLSKEELDKEEQEIIEVGREISIEEKAKPKKARAKRTVADSQVILPKKNADKLVTPVKNVSNAKGSKVEIEMLKRVNRDLSIPAPTEEEKKLLNYDNGNYVPDALYYSGDIYKKIESLEKYKQETVEAVGQEQYDKQLKGLQKVLPKKIALKDISFDPIDRHVAQEETGEKDYSGDTRNVVQAFTAYIRTNQVSLSPRVEKWDIIRYVTGQMARKDTKPITGLIKADAKRLFNHFINNELDVQTQEKILDRYNREKNAYVRPDYSKLPVEVQDMSNTFRGDEFNLSQTQKEGIGFLVHKGSGAIAYGVGVGKTHTLAIATKANMDKGWTKRPLFTVPKSTIDKTWLATLSDIFPKATINNLEGLQAPVVARLKKSRGPDPKNWIQDGELTVISHEGLLRLGFKEGELRQSVGDLSDALWREPGTKRGEEKQSQEYDEIVGNAQKYVTDIMLTDLGFDHVSVDEVHNFRKIFQGAKPEKEGGEKGGRKRFANVIGGTPSRRAQQLFLITQHIQKNNGGRNVFLASATPFENHATEVYNILSLVARDRMKDMGLLNINDFFSAYANFEVELDRTLKGEWINREKMKSFSNLQSLQSLIKEFIDFQVDETLVRPDRKVLTPHLQMSEKQIDNLERIQDLLTGTTRDGDEVSQKDKADDGAFLKASTYSIANSLSPWFIKEYAGDTTPTAEQIVKDSPKLQYALEVIKTIKNDPKTSDFGTFLFFGKLGVEHHPALAKYFARELGFKDSEVAYLSGDVTEDEKEIIKERFNNGKVKVLLGGDQTKEGIDLQNNGFATINLALGWNPTQIAQVEGRVWRQGNRRTIAPLIYPLVENSGDSMIYGKFEEKGGRINDLFSYAGTIFDVGEIDPAEKKIALLTNPEDKTKIQIEINKTAFQNESVLLEADIKSLVKAKSDMETLRSSVEYLTRKSEDKDYNPEQIKEYKKELKADKEKLKRLEAKFSGQDIEAKIIELRGKQTDLNKQISEINDTAPALLAKFKQEYNEQIAKRKSIPQLMDEVKKIIEQVNERTPEEIAELRASKISELEKRRSDLSAGAVNASIGKYNETEDLVIGDTSKVKPIEFPELVDLARELTGGVPTIQKFKRAFGRFYDQGRGQIKLSPEIFERGKEKQLTGVLAHEIGHLTDYLPDKTLARGNLLGRLLTLRRFLNQTYGGITITNREIRDELIGVSEYWKPYNKAEASPSYIRYRESARELYADAVSLLLNHPQTLQDMAPKFYDSFFNKLDEKEDFKTAYFNLQALLWQDEEVLTQHRRGGVRQMFSEGDYKAKQLEALRREEKKKRDNDYLFKLKFEVVDKNYAVIDRVNQLKKQGVYIPDDVNPVYLLEELNYLPGKMKAILETQVNPIYQGLNEEAITWTDFGEALLYERIIKGDRSEFANPRGITINEAPKLLADLEKSLGEERAAKLHEAMEQFRDVLRGIAEEAYEEGLYSEELHEQMKENPAYVTFQTIEHLEKNLTSKVYKQVGTLKDITNPADASILKALATVKAVEHNKAKRSIVKMLNDNFSGDIEKAKKDSNGKVIETREKNKGTIIYMEGGKPQGYHTDTYTVRTLEKNTELQNFLLVKVLSIANAKLFRPLFISFNLGFQSFNLARDFIRFWKNVPSMTLFRALKRYGQAVRPSKVRAFGLKARPSEANEQAQELISKLEYNKTLSVTLNDLVMGQEDEDTRIDEIMAKYGVAERTSKLNPALRPIMGLLDFIKKVGDMIETLPKVAGYYELTEKGIMEPKEMASFIRRKIGSPDFMAGGWAKPLTNNVALFSNAITQGIRTDVEVATNPTTRSGYWIKTVQINFIPKLLMLFALAGFFGDKLKELMGKASEYDRTNYTIVPLGTDQNGKAIYLRIPSDESGRTLGGIFWKALRAFDGEGSILRDMRDILSYTGGQLPSLTPAIDVVSDWWTFLSGRNPYDDFRGRNVLTDDEFRAGGWYATKPFLMYQWNQMGGSIFHKFYSSGTSIDRRSDIERIISYPIISNILGRWIRVSDFGETESIRKGVKAEVESEQSKRRLEKKELVDKYVDKYEADSNRNFKIRLFENELIKEYLGHLPRTKEEAEEANRLRKSFKLARNKSAGDPRVNELIYTQTNEAKTAVLVEMHRDIGDQKYGELLRLLLKEGIISDTVAQQARVEYNKSK